MEYKCLSQQPMTTFHSGATVSFVSLFSDQVLAACRDLVGARRYQYIYIGENSIFMKRNSVTKRENMRSQYYRSHGTGRQMNPRGTKRIICATLSFCQIKQIKAHYSWRFFKRNNRNMHALLDILPICVCLCACMSLLTCACLFSYFGHTKIGGYLQHKLSVPV